MCAPSVAAQRTQSAAKVSIRPITPPQGAALWDTDLVAARLGEAVDTLHRMPMPRNGRPAGFRMSWPQTASDPEMVTVAERSDEPTRPGAPSPQSIRRMEECLPEWLLLIDDLRQRQAVFLRATPTRDRRATLSTRRVGKILGVSHQTVANWEAVALDRIASALNRALALRPTDRA